jgi:DnaJ-class molecular chaperone
MPERGPEREPHEVTCPQCHGSGQVKDSKGNARTCDRCHGKGTILSRY